MAEALKPDNREPIMRIAEILEAILAERGKQVTEAQGGRDGVGEGAGRPAWSRESKSAGTAGRFPISLLLPHDHLEKCHGAG